VAKDTAKVVSEIAAHVAAQEQLQADAELARLRAELAGIKAKYKPALDRSTKSVSGPTVHGVARRNTQALDQELSKAESGSSTPPRLC
jgi:hypothetical protein